MVVGGFGIANIMLISVVERRREIGVRQALGHRRIAIALQFLDGVSHSRLLGSIVRASLAVGFVILVSEMRGWVVVLDLAVVIAAVAAAIPVSILGGVYPARRAARLEPLDALRHE